MRQVGQLPRITAWCTVHKTLKGCDMLVGKSVKTYKLRLYDVLWLVCGTWNYVPCSTLCSHLVPGWPNEALAYYWVVHLSGTNMKVASHTNSILQILRSYDLAALQITFKWNQQTRSFPNSFLYKTLHVLSSSSAHHQESATVHLGLARYTGVMTASCRHTCITCQCRMYSSWLLMMGRGTTQNM